MNKHKHLKKRRYVSPAHFAWKWKGTLKEVRISFGLGSYTLAKNSNEEVAFFPNNIAIAAQECVSIVQSFTSRLRSWLPEKTLEWGDKMPTELVKETSFNVAIKLNR